MRALTGLLFASLFVLGCDQDPGADAGPSTDGGVDAGTDAGPPTDEPTKGPWVIRVDTTSAVVRWETLIEPAAIEVGFEPLSGGTTMTVVGTSTPTEVTTSYGEDLRAVREPDLAGTYYLNDVRLEGLSPATCYTYRVTGYDTADGRVCTTHEATDHTTPIHFLAIGDTNPTIGDTAVLLPHVLAPPPEFVVHVGDVQYYATIIETWRSWFRLMEPLLETGPMYPAAGNHEVEIPGEFDDYFARFWDAPGQDGETLHYHYETGGVHFFALTTEEELADRTEQVAWLETRLSEVEVEPGYRFSIVYFHHPIYTLSSHAPDMTLRAQIEPVLIAHGVPLVFQGHNHVYERFVVGDVTYVTTGGGGAALYDLDVQDLPAEAPLRVAGERAHHAVTVEIVDTTIMAEAVRIDGMTIDSFTITVP